MTYKVLQETENHYLVEVVRNVRKNGKLIQETRQRIVPKDLWKFFIAGHGDDNNKTPTKEGS